MYMEYEETPTLFFRWNTFQSRASPRLEQQWRLREGSIAWIVWREVPTVEEDNRITPISLQTFD